MNHKTSNNIFLFFSLMLVYVIALFLQQKLFLNTDLGSLLITTGQLLDGKKYGIDFFIPNPPMTLYVYTLPVVFSRLTGLSIAASTISYVFILASLSLGLCVYLKKNLPALFIITLAIIYLIIPTYNLGQRDHLQLIFIMPYLLLINLRVENKPVSLWLSVTVGCLLAIIVGMKPQFLITPLLIEAYYACTVKKWFAWVRPEIIVSLILFAIYMAIIFIYHGEFLTIITPYVLKNYHYALSGSWTELITLPEMLFCFIPLAMYFLFPHKDKSSLNVILFIALISAILCYLAQRTTFSHHIIPAFSLGILITTLFLSDIATQKKVYVFDVLLLSPLVLLVAFFSLAIVYPLLNTTSQLIYFIIFGVLFTYYFFIFLLMSKASGSGNQRVLLPFFTSTILLSLFLVTYSNFSLGTAYKKSFLHKLIAFSRQFPPDQSVYFISPGTNRSIPFIFYTNYHLYQRYDCVWMIGELQHDIITYNDNIVRAYLRNNRDPLFFLNQMARDIESEKPDLIFVDQYKFNRFDPSHPFYFLNYFLESIDFKRAWTHYSYVTTFKSDYPSTIKLLVFKRKTNT